jgi:hypothetical protein
MSRELRRVPLDFDWPLKKVWDGFVNPHYRECPEAAKNNCIAGYTPAGKWLESIARLIALVGEEAALEPHAEQVRSRGRIYPHPYLVSWEQAPRTELTRAEIARLRKLEDPERHRAMLRRPSLLPFGPELVALVQGLAKGRELGPFAGGSFSYEIWLTLIQASGVDERWGICKTCDGDGVDPAIRETYEAWEPAPPPTGEGWQLWETTSEGSPVSKVYPTEKAFVQYLIGEGYSEKAAKRFCKSGWAPSGMIEIGEDGQTKQYRDIEAHDALGDE